MKRATDIRRLYGGGPQVVLGASGGRQATSQTDRCLVPSEPDSRREQRVHAWPCAFVPRPNSGCSPVALEE